MPPSHCREFCLRTNMNWHALRIAQHCIDSNYFVFVRCHFRISLQANMNVLKSSKHSYWPFESKPILLRQIASPNVVSIVSVPIGSYLIVVHAYRFIVHSHWNSPPVCCDSVRCNTMHNDCIVVLDRTCSHWSCKFLLVPIVFSSHHSTIVLILHHHRTASYCIVSPSCCILLHLTASYQFVFNSCLIGIDSQIIIVSNLSGSA